MPLTANANAAAVAGQVFGSHPLNLAALVAQDGRRIAVARRDPTALDGWVNVAVSARALIVLAGVDVFVNADPVVDTPVAGMTAVKVPGVEREVAGGTSCGARLRVANL